jgi:hypothetical protein
MTFVALVLMVTSAHAHVAPSVDDNNRYLKVTPLKGGFRLAYTVFFGEIPGAQERKILDDNRDGRIDDAEKKRFGDKLASEVAASLQLELVVRPPAQRDAALPTSIRWQTIDVGLGGTGTVAAGAFSVDMIAYVCAPSGHIRVRDSFRIPRPGETEVIVEDSPGITVTNAHVGPADDMRHDWRFLGAGGPLTDDGVEVEWTAAASAPVVPAKCDAPARAESRSPWTPARTAIVLAVIVAGLGVGVVLGRYLRRK